MNKALPLLLLFIVFGTLRSSAQLTVSTAPTHNQLVQNILLGPGVFASNVTFNGTVASRGSFTCSNACNVGFPNGVLLTSGTVANAIGPNNSPSQTGGSGTPGDPTLNSIVAPNTTQDAAVLEFDFSVATDSVEFRYVFGSEEYNEFVNTGFNDVFGFFISGPGITGVANIALIPGTTTAVAINNVNNGNSAGVSAGPCNNCSYYRDNIGGLTVEYDGMTVILTARAKVCPCEVYHIKLAIADVSDGAYDSGVFLEANSFQAMGEIPLLDSLGLEVGNDTIYICPGDSVELSLPVCRNPLWSTGDTTQSIYVNTPGTYYASVANPPFCFAFSSTYTVLNAPAVANISASGPLAFCVGDSVILTANQGVSYLWSNGSTSQSITVHNTGTFTVTVSSGGNCIATSAPVNVNVSPGAVATITPSGPITFCQGGNVTLQANNGVGYQWSTGATSQTINVNSSGVYTLTVDQGLCSSTTSVTVTVNQNPVAAITGPTSICQGAGSATLNAGAGFSSYLWSTGQNSQTINPAATGNYTVTVTNASGCSASAVHAFTLNPFTAPVISGPSGFCTGSSATLTASAGYSNYQWSNGISTQTNSLNTAGTYTVTVTAANGCTGTTSAILNSYTLPVPVINGSPAICQGETAILTAGPAGANYLWNNGTTASTLNATATGIYTVTVTDANNCSAQTSHNLTVNANPVAQITGTLTVCQGNSGNLDAGNTFSSYLWSDGTTGSAISPSTSGSYWVEVTDANGCTDRDTVQFTVNALPSVNITGITALCQGANTTLQSSAVFPSYQWSTGAVTSSINVNSPGTYTLTVTDANNCQNSASVNINVTALPVPVLTNATICQGDNASLNPGVFTGYLWSDGSTGSTLTTGNAGNYTVTVSDVNGCTGSTSASVIVNSLPVPSITGPSAICAGDNANLDAGNTFVSYLWSDGTTGSSTTAQNAGSYTVTVTDNNGCEGSTSFLLNVNALPVPVITGNMSFCQGASTNIQSQDPYVSYNWSTGATSQSINVTSGGTYTLTVTDNNNCSNSVSASVTVNNLPQPVMNNASVCQGDNAILQPGNYSSYLWSDGSTGSTLSTQNAGNYTVTVTDINGCTGSVSALVTVNALPVPVITGPAAICAGDNALLDAGSYPSYIWSDGSVTSTINTSAAGSYTVTVTDANGCAGSAVYNLTVNPLPQPVISGDLDFCQGLSTSLQGDPGHTSYLWSDGSTGTSINVTNGGVYTLTVTSADNCINSVSANVIMNPLPQPVLPASVSICDGDNAILQPGNYASYLWSDGSTGNNLTISTAGNYAVTVTDNNGCIGTTSSTLIVNALPQPVITGPSDICDGEIGVLDAGSVYSAYAWSSGGSSSTLNVTAAGTYTVTVTDANGCKGNAQYNLIVLPLPQVAITGDDGFCEGTSATFGTIPGQGTYVWSNGAITENITVNTGGNYSVVVTALNGCINQTATFITEHKNPVASFTSGQSISCEAITFDFINNSTYDAGSTFGWTFGDGTTGNSPQPHHSYSVPGDYDITLTIITPFGCTHDTMATITADFPHPPVAKFEVSADLVTVFSSGIQLKNLSQHATHYQWNFGDGTTSIEENPYHHFDVPGDVVIKLVAWSGSDCMDEYEIPIHVAPYWIPNAFTPNNDGRNDVFFDGNPVFDAQSFEMQIFDRWGKRIYVTDSYLMPWDGILENGSEASQGVYTYVIRIVSHSGKPYEFRETFSLIR